MQQHGCKHWVNQVLYERLHIVCFQLYDILELAKSIYSFRSQDSDCLCGAEWKGAHRDLLGGLEVFFQYFSIYLSAVDVSSFIYESMLSHSVVSNFSES